MADTIITLRSSDGDEFKLPRAQCEFSRTIQNIIVDIDDLSAPLELPNVSGKILSKVIEYIKHHHASVNSDKKDDFATDSISPWDENFTKVDQGMLFELILAANFLDIKSLLDLTCRTVADMIKGKTAEEIRKTFNIKNDFTPEEEVQVRKENEWCEERG